MANVRPRLLWPTVPSLSAVNYQSPVTGQVLQAMAQGVNYMHGWRFRRAVHTQVDFNVSGEPRADRTYIGPTGNREIKVTFRTSVNAKYLWVGFAYSTTADYTKGATYVDVSLNVAFGGAVIDQGCRFDTGRGDLCSKKSTKRFGPLGLFATHHWPMQTTHTGIIPVDSPVAYPTVPRPLNVGANTDTDVEVLVESSDVRVYSVDVWELFLPEVAQ